MIADDTPPAWLEERPGGVRLRIRVQPRAARTEVTGPHGDTLKVRVAAPPVEGEANRQLIRFLADKFGVPPSTLRIVHGETGRTKTIEVAGITAARARRALLT